MDGARVAAIEGSTSILQINDHAAANGVSVEIVPFQVYPPSVDALLAGDVAAVTTDSVALQQFARDNPELHVVGGLFTYEPYGIGLRAGDVTFVELVNSSLQALKVSGVYDDLYAVWFGDNVAPYAVEILPGSEPIPFADVPDTLEIPLESRMEQILRTGVFFAGIEQDRRPFGFIDDDGSWSGFDIDLMREFAGRWLGDENAVRLIPISARDGADKVATGEVDLITTAVQREGDSAEAIDFSQTYYEEGLIGLPRFDHTFRDLINFTLQELKSDGTYDRLYGKWFGDAEPFSLEVWPGQSYLPVSLTPMARIPGGAFMRGSEQGLRDEQPMHEVTVDEFYIDKYEITNRQYDLCVRCRLLPAAEAGALAHQWPLLCGPGLSQFSGDLDLVGRRRGLIVPLSASGCRPRPSGKRPRGRTKASSIRGGTTSRPTRAISTTFMAISRRWGSMRGMPVGMVSTILRATCVNGLPTGTGGITTKIRRRRIRLVRTRAPRVSCAAAVGMMMRLRCAARRGEISCPIVPTLVSVFVALVQRLHPAEVLSVLCRPLYSSDGIPPTKISFFFVHHSGQR